MGATRRPRTIVLIVGVGILAAASVGGYLYQSARNSTESNVTRTVTVARGDVASTLRLTGYVASLDERAINPRVSGTATRVYVGVGDQIKAGQRLLELGDAEAKRQLQVARTQLESAELKLDELEDNSASDAQIAEAEVGVHRAEADLAAAQAALKDTVLASPIAGTVLAVGANVGDFVSAGGGGGGGAAAANSQSAQTSANSALITVADLSRLRIEAAIDQADISKVAKGQPVKITLDALADQEFTGVVASVNPVPETNQNVVTYTAFISFDKQSPSVRLGMTADLELVLGRKENVLTLPNAAIRSVGGRRVVAKVVGGAPQLVRIETGLADEQRTEIVDGLSEGDEVAVRLLTGGTGATGPGGGFFGGPGFGPPPGFGGAGGSGRQGRFGGQGGFGGGGGASGGGGGRIGAGADH